MKFFFLTKAENMVKVIVLIISTLLLISMAKSKGKLAKDLDPFHLTSLLIRRVRELMDGSPALVETDSSEPVKTVFEELASGKISVTDAAVTKG